MQVATSIAGINHPPSLPPILSTFIFYPSQDKTIPVTTYIRQYSMADHDHYNDPPHDTVEPPGTNLSHNFSEPLSTSTSTIYRSQDKTITVTTCIRQHNMADHDHHNDPPHDTVEPPGYQSNSSDALSTSTSTYPYHDKTITVTTCIEKHNMANHDHYNDPPYDTVEPPDYQSWRTKLSHNFSEAMSTANDIDNDNLKFWNNTEVRILSMLQKPPEIWHEVIFGWDLDGGVWILDPTPKVDSDRSIYVKLHTLLREEFMHWNQALAECGAKYYKNCIHPYLLFIVT